MQDVVWIDPDVVTLMHREQLAGGSATTRPISRPKTKREHASVSVRTSKVR